MTSKDIIASRYFQTQKDALDYFGTVEKLEEFLEFLRKRKINIIDLFVERGILEYDEENNLFL